MTQSKCRNSDKGRRGEQRIGSNIVCLLWSEAVACQSRQESERWVSMARRLHYGSEVDYVSVEVVLAQNMTRLLPESSLIGSTRGCGHFFHSLPVGHPIPSHSTLLHTDVISTCSLSRTTDCRYTPACSCALYPLLMNQNPARENLRSMDRCRYADSVRAKSISENRTWPHPSASVSSLNLRGSFLKWPVHIKDDIWQPLRGRIIQRGQGVSAIIVK